MARKMVSSFQWNAPAMRRLTRFMTLSWLAIGFAQSATAIELQIVRQQRIAIIAPERMSSALSMAVKDLADYLQQSLSVVVRRYPPTTDLSQIDESCCFAIGPKQSNPFIESLRAGGFQVDAADLGEEGSRVKATSIGDRTVVALTGSTDQGASYAVYSFLEKEVGVGFFIGKTC